jgi:hydroxyacylglutathione hydrolase
MSDHDEPSHVVREPTLPFEVADGAGRVIQVPLGVDNLGWIVACTATGEAALVDGPDAGPYLARCAALGLRPTTVWNTHTHGDHVGLNRDLQARGLLASMRVYGPASVPPGAVPGLTDPVDEGDVASVGPLRAAVIRTDGHLDGHVSFVVDDAEAPALFCGDTLFGAGCGYLFDGPPAAMHDSLRRLAALPGATRVCCAHEYTWDNLRFAAVVDGDNDAVWRRVLAAKAARDDGRSCVPSTIDDERATNPFLRAGDRTLRAFALRSIGLAVPSTPADAFACLRAAKNERGWRLGHDDDWLAQMSAKSAENRRRD